MTSKFVDNTHFFLIVKMTDDRKQAKCYNLFKTGWKQALKCSAVVI